jgi:hypothetical protein
MIPGDMPETGDGCECEEDRIRWQILAVIVIIAVTAVALTAVVLT